MTCDASRSAIGNLFYRYNHDGYGEKADGVAL